MRKSAVLAVLKSWQAGGILLLGSSLLFGCSQPTQEPQANETFELAENQQFLFKGTGRDQALSQQEWASYRADRRYLSSLAPEGRSVVINHADERQHRFVLLRMKLAGKTPQSSPQLFKLIAAKRSEHLAKGYKPGTFAEDSSMSTSSTGDTEHTNKHYFNSLNVITDTQMEVMATASVKDELFYGYVDTAAWDVNGAPISDMAYTEIYGNMPYQSAQTTGDLTRTETLEYEGDSLVVQDKVSGGYQELYMRAESKRPTPTIFGPPQIVAPVDVNGDSGACPISVCLNRTWTQDCDYDLTGTPTAFKLPLKGNIAITSAGSVFDEDKINQYRSGSAVDSIGQRDEGGQLRVVLTNVGGGCNVDRFSALYSGMQRFWNSVKLSADKKTLSWDMTGDNAALFDDSCRQVQDKVELSMNLKLPYLNGPARGTYNLHMTNNMATVDLKTRVFKCIKVTNSCFAAGTMISMADGSNSAIESLKAGDQVFSPHDMSDAALAIADTAKGVELEPMVRIEAASGHSLMMTQMHPMPVVGRGMVLAKHLKVGDTVSTLQGPSPLVKVSRVPYEGMVYNLKVGSNEELQKLGEDQTVVYANGFLVGDGQIQSKYEALEQAPKRTARLPLRWKKDFVYSAGR